MTEEFFKSEIVQEELNDLQETYTDLLQMSQEFEGFDTGQKIEHINKTLELIAKQKVFYSRLEMMANYVAEEEDSETEVQEMKERIDLGYTIRGFANRWSELTTDTVNPHEKEKEGTPDQEGTLRKVSWILQGLLF